MAAHAAVARLNTRLFLNCLEGVADADAARRPNERTNSLGFVACHVLDARHFLARYLGLSEAHPLEEVLRAATGIEDVVALPSVARIEASWRALAPTLEACLDGLGPSELAAPSRQRFPVDLPTVEGGIAFLLQHESYHVGQMALLRKYLGHPAMKYS